VNNDLDVSDIETDEAGVTIYGASNDYNLIRTAISDTMPELELDTDEIMWLPIMETTLDLEEDQEKFERLLAMLDEIDDVQDVYHNVIL